MGWFVHGRDLNGLVNVYWGFRVSLNWVSVSFPNVKRGIFHHIVAISSLACSYMILHSCWMHSGGGKPWRLLRYGHFSEKGCTRLLIFSKQCWSHSIIACFRSLTFLFILLELTSHFSFWIDRWRHNFASILSGTGCQAHFGKGPSGGLQKVSRGCQDASETNDWWKGGFDYSVWRNEARVRCGSSSSSLQGTWAPSSNYASLHSYGNEAKVFLKEKKSINLRVAIDKHLKMLTARSALLIYKKVYWTFEKWFLLCATINEKSKNSSTGNFIKKSGFAYFVVA
jgi:hypothetical protein